MPVLKKLALLSMLVAVVSQPVFLSCSHRSNPQKLTAYLKAEKELHARVTLEQGLKDSTLALEKRFNLNREKEIEKMKNNPDAWKSLLEALVVKK